MYDIKKTTSQRFSFEIQFFIRVINLKENPKFDPELAAWVESANDGLVVFSMGSMVRSMHPTKSEMIARALARLKVADLVDFFSIN